GPKADQNCPETRIALLGNEDAGKSTLIHVLLKGMLDDGHGSRKIASEIGATAYVKFQASVAEDKSFVKVIVRKGWRRCYFGGKEPYEFSRKSR
ncbi:hypothetical protein QYM36_002138, partial [Artemia franciscana]